MKFVISSSVLSKQLTSLSGAIVSNPVVPILENFLFEIKDGILKLTASDSQNSIVAEMRVDADKDCSIAVPAKMMLDTLKNLPEQPVTFVVNESAFSVELISEYGRYKLTGEDADDYIKLPEVKATSEVTLSSSSILKAINSTLFATSTDDHRPAMNGVFIALSPEGTEFVATDAHRLVKYKRADVNSSKAESILVPRKTLTLLKSILPSANTELTISYNGSNACFSFANLKLTCRLIDENFPNYQNVIPVNNANILTVDRLEFIGSLKRMMIYANKSTNLVKLTLTTDELQVSAEDIDFSNEANEKLACTYEGDDLEIGFSAKFLIEILSNLETNNITVKLAAPEKPGLLMPSDQAENEDMLMLLMPVMLTSYHPNY